MANKILITVPVYHEFHLHKEELSHIAEAFEIKKAYDKIETKKPKIFHTDGLVNTEFDNHLTKEFFEYLKGEKIEVFSCDLGPSSLKVKVSPGGYWAAASSVLTQEEILSIAEKKIAVIKKNFKGKILLENLDYHPGGAYEHVCKPEVINRFVKKAGVGLLLDIPHAKVSAKGLGMPFSEYLRKLPLETVVEVHISRTTNKGDMIIDSHESLEVEELKELSIVLKKTPNAKYITIEYYKKIDLIIKGYVNLKRMIK